MMRYWMFPTLVSLMLFGAVPVQAGTPSNPEIIDQATDSDLLAGERIGHLEITKAWVEPKGERFHFTIEIANLQEVPQDSVYVFHYTYKSYRLYFRANYTADGSEFQYSGGMYEGVKDPSIAFDPQGNRNYFYMPGGPDQSDRIKGDVKEGAPGRITWSYPMSAYDEDRANLAFKGMFVTTYKKIDGRLQFIDTGLSQRDYEHQIYTPWYTKFLPGPSPAMILAALGVVGIAVQGARRKSE